MAFLSLNLLAAFFFFFANRETLSVFVFPYQINHRAFIRKVCCVDHRVPSGLSLVFVTHTVSQRLLIL